jgi:hypothetical protein
MFSSPFLIMAAGEMINPVGLAALAEVAQRDDRNDSRRLMSRPRECREC